MKCEICGGESGQFKICNNCKSIIFEEKQIPCEICGKISNKEICPECSAKIETYKNKKIEQERKEQSTHLPQQSTKPIQTIKQDTQAQQPIIIQVPQSGNQRICPNCGSSNISTRTETRHKKSTVLSILSFLLMLIIGAIAIVCIVLPKPTPEEINTTYEKGIEKLNKEKLDKALTMYPMSNSEYNLKKEELDRKKNEDLEFTQFASTATIVLSIVAGIFLILFFYSLARKETITFDICKNCNQKQ